MTGTREGGRAERLGVLLYRWWLHALLPRGLSRRMGDPMVDVFRARHRAAAGRWATAAAWAHEFGGVLAAAAAARVGGSAPVPVRRDRTKRGRPMDTVMQDVRYGLRAMARRPGATSLAVLTFGLGIAASTAMYSVVDAVLLRPLPYPEPEAVVSVYTSNPELEGHPTLGFAADRGPFSWPEFQTVRDNGSDVLDGLAILSRGGALVYGVGEPERIALGNTSADLFGRVLRTGALHGRVFDDEDARTGANVLVLDEDYWRARHGADPRIVGSTLRLSDTPFTVIGIVASDKGVAGFDVDGWRLAGADDNWDNHWEATLIGRLRPGVSADQASARLTAVLSAALPADHEHGVNVFERHADETRSVRGALWLLTAAAALLLVVACGNVAALLVGAAIDREQELAVRAALGAGRGRIVRQLLTESTLLGAGAAAVGVLLSVGATRALALIAPEGVPRIGEAAIDGSALAFAVALSLACGFLFGLAPALNFSRADLRRAMTTTTRGATGGRGRLQGVVVVGELALATVLLVGAGLLARTLLALSAVDHGFAVRETLAVQLGIPSSRLVQDPQNDSARFAAVDAFFRRAVAELSALPGVRGVGLTSNLPLSPDASNNDVQLAGHDENIVAERRFVSPDYFDVLGIRIIEGRAFTVDEDRPDAAAAMIISEGLAKRAWPGQSALGRRVTYWGSREATVVGVVTDIRDEEVQSATTYAFYVPRRQAGQLGGSFVIRADGDPADLIPAVRARAREIHPDIAIVAARPLTDYVAEQIASERYRARLVLVFAGLAALFSLLGVYGVTARSVAARTRELGIRMALGARRDGVMGLVLGQAVRLAAIGALVGIALSFIATRAIEAYLWGVEPTDPITFATIALFLGAASVVAALAPGLRAARMDPVEALRTE